MAFVSNIRNKISSKRATRAISAAFALVFLSLALTGCDQPEPQVKTEPAIKAVTEPVSNSPSFNSTVRLTTELGNIDIELFSTAAPITTANFLAYVDAGLYSSNGESQMSFYRTVRDDNQAQNNIKIAVIQGGLMDKSMTPVGNGLHPIEHETTEQTGILHTDGIVSLARGEPGTGSSEIFIVLGDQPSLDFGGMRNPDGQGFAAFGKVVRGMHLVRKIHQAKTITPEGDTLDYTSGQFIKQPVRVLSSERLMQLDN